MKAGCSRSVRCGLPPPPTQLCGGLYRTSLCLASPPEPASEAYMMIAVACSGHCVGWKADRPLFAGR